MENCPFENVGNSHIYHWYGQLWNTVRLCGIRTSNKIVMLSKTLKTQAARFITRDYRSRESGSVTSMLGRLNLPTIQERREIDKMVYMFKIGTVTAINADKYFIP